MKINKYIWIAALTALLFSCSLEEEPYGFLSTDNFYQSTEDAESAVMYAYAILPEIEYYSRYWIVITELPTENLSIKPDGGASNFELDELRTQPDNTELETLWRYAYNGINRANAVIENVPDIEGMDKAYQNQLVGEGYFLRALHHYNLVRLFGSVPIRSELVTEMDQLEIGLSSIEDIYELITSDLRTAAALMDTEKREGRANKIVAWALLAKAYIHQASSKSTGSPGYDYVSSADQMYANAAVYADSAINEPTGAYGFEAEVLDIWDIANENGPEFIFSVSTDITGEQEGNYSKLPLMFIPYIDGATFLIAADSTPVASGWNHFVTESCIYESYLVGDKRKDQLIVTDILVEGDEGAYEQRSLGINDYSRPFTRKYLDPNRSGDKTGVNTPVIRYTDMLLTYAEAVGPTAEGYAAVNQVRNRAGIAELTTGLNTSDFRDSVILERAWEFAFEGNRLFDLRRTNSMEEVLEGQYGKVIESNAYFYDIPLRETDSNDQI